MKSTEVFPYRGKHVEFRSFFGCCEARKGRGNELFSLSFNTILYLMNLYSANKPGGEIVVQAVTSKVSPRG